MNKHTLRVLQRCYVQPFTVQSNYAREKAIEVAELASRGLITTHVGQGTYSKHWRVSPSGMSIIEFQHGEER